MITAVDPSQNNQQESLKVKKLLTTRDLMESELPSEDEHDDSDYLEEEDCSDDQEEQVEFPLESSASVKAGNEADATVAGYQTMEIIQEEEEDEDDHLSDISVDEIKDIIIEYSSLHQNDKILRNGKNFDVSYRETTIMRDFASDDDEDDEDFVPQHQEEEDSDVNVDSEEEVDDDQEHRHHGEDVDLVSAQEVHDIVYDAVTAPAATPALLKSGKVLRDGKELASINETDMQALVIEMMKTDV